MLLLAWLAAVIAAMIGGEGGRQDGLALLLLLLLLLLLPRRCCRLLLGGGAWSSEREGAEAGWLGKSILPWLSVHARCGGWIDSKASLLDLIEGVWIDC